MIGVSGRRSCLSEGLRGPTIAAGSRYCDAVVRANGLPIVLDPSTPRSEIPSLLRRLDGLVLTGGGDVDPRHYGGDANDPRLLAVNPELDAFELSLTVAALEADIPILAICRGMQLLNVALGGSLYVDVADGSADPSDHRDTFHDVELVRGSRLFATYGTSARNCHSFHHQCIRTVGAGLRVAGFLHDSIIEAIEHPIARWVVGVQWHPEDTAEIDSAHQRLFDVFVAETVAGASRCELD